MCSCTRGLDTTRTFKVLYASHSGTAQSQCVGDKGRDNGGTRLNKGSILAVASSGEGRTPANVNQDCLSGFYETHNFTRYKKSSAKN